jgi:hypothetical protein
MKNFIARIKIIIVAITTGFCLIPLTTIYGSAQQGVISIGEYVQVDTGNQQRLNLRQAPGINQGIVTSLENGTIMLVIGGPVRVDGFDWWEIKGQSGTGWAVGQFLKEVEISIGNTSPVYEIIDERDLVLEHIADNFGFSGCYFQTLPEFPYIKIDVAKSFPQVKKTSNLLTRAGYKSTAHENRRADDAILALPNDEIFFFYGHGYYRALQFHDNNCDKTYLLSEQISEIETTNLKFVLLIGCNTGKNIEKSENIMRAFQLSGANKVIGFSEDVDIIGSWHWNNSFWTYAIEDGMEVSDAAMKAVFENIWGTYWLSPRHLVILGDTDVFLLPVEDKSIDVSQFMKMLVDSLQRFWEGLLEDMQARLIDMLKVQLQNYLDQIQQALLEYIYQCCASPLSFMVIIGYFVLRYRQRNFINR